MEFTKAVHLRRPARGRKPASPRLAVLGQTGIIGVGYSPYVGDWIGSPPAFVLWKTYTPEQILALLQPVPRRFGLISTYGEGFVGADSLPMGYAHGADIGELWEMLAIGEGASAGPDAARYIIEAASKLGLAVSAGVTQFVRKDGSWDLDASRQEIDFVLQEARKFGNVIDMVITNESLWKREDVLNGIHLMEYAIQQRDAAGFTAAQLPITTRQQPFPYLLANNPACAYQAELKQLFSLVEGYGYVNIYSYFNVDAMRTLGPNPSKKQFVELVTRLMTASMQELRESLRSAGLALDLRIGETGWPTAGSEGGQPDVSLANRRFAEWHWEAISKWSAQAGVVVAGYFECLDEPWKGTADGTNAEAHWGLWQALGRSSSVNDYKLSGIRQKYRLA